MMTQLIVNNMYLNIFNINLVYDKILSYLIDFNKIRSKLVYEGKLLFKYLLMLFRLGV